MKGSKKKNSRRKFIKNSSLAVGSFYIVPRHVLGRGYTAPSDKLNLAAIGAGGKGGSDITNSWNKGKNNVVALCDVDTNLAAGTVKKFPKAKFYKDFRVMLDKMSRRIDAVTISTPDHIHGVAAKMAIDRGMHVYVQKPLTHNIYEARQLTKAARENKVVTQMGNQGASNPEQLQMQKWMAENVIGDVSNVHCWTNRPVWPQGIPVPTEKVPLPDHLSKEDWDLYIGPAKYVDYHPLYHAFKWRGWWNFGTGALGDMGCHIIDPAFKTLKLGYPSEVQCSVSAIFKRDWSPEHIPEGCPPASTVKIRFPKNSRQNNDINLYWYDGGIKPFHPSIIPADHNIGDEDGSNGVMIEGSKGIMSCGTYGINPKVYLNTGEILEVDKTYAKDFKWKGSPEFGHQISWTEACKAGFNSPEHQALTSSFDYSGPLTETVLMGNLAIRSYSLAKMRPSGHRNYYGRKKLLWDGQAMKITNFDEANQFVSRKYRRGWELI